MEAKINLDGRVALVTGSTRGIGWACARKLAQAGASVILNGCSHQEVLTGRIAELESEFGAQVMGVLSDAGDAAQVRDCYARIFSRFKRLDILVNNAGVLQEGLLGMIAEPAIRRALEVNVFGAIMGRNGAEGLSVYCATKAALNGLTLAAAKELAPKNIRVNAVAPGFIETDMTRSLPEPLYAKRLSSVKMGRAGTPDEVAETVLFLASDLSRYVTGQL